MTERRIRPYHYTCTECEPLPPIENLHPDSFDQQREDTKTRGLLESLTARIRPIRKAS